MTRNGVGALFGRILLVLFAGLVPRAEAQGIAAHGPTALSRIQTALDLGEIGESEASRQELYDLFDRSRMDPRWRAEGEPPAKCGTVVLAQIAGRLDRLDDSTRALYARTVGAAQTSAQLASYDTQHFHIEYATTGPDAPPSTDVSPADGIPDFVERTGEAAEHSWAIEVGTLGYLPPPLGNPGHRYTIGYQNQSSYGYTFVVSGQTTQIVLHPNYIDFPPNDDPDGDVLGSLRVTVAHELKHAIQRMYTDWAENNWLELDATWVEDIVYDDVNDYVNFVRGPGSPFTAPATPLNAGGSGSYEDCNWEHFQSQTYGNDFLLHFWQRRAAAYPETVVDSYVATFALEGVTLEDAWGEYVCWNFASGARSDPAFGYREASLYPTPPAATVATALPVPTTSWTVSNFAVGAHLVENYDGALAGTPEFTFSGSAQIAWRVSVLIQRRSGAVTRIPMELTSGIATLQLTGYDWADLSWAALMVGNPYEGGPPFGYTFSARAVAPILIDHARLWDQAATTPVPVAARVVAGTGQVSPGSVTLTYRVNGGATTSLPMSPTGNPDEYAASVPGQPYGAVVEYAIGARSLAGDDARAPVIPGAFYSYQVVTLYEPFENGPDGWTVGDTDDNATSGIWELATPKGTVSAPYADATPPPGTMCFVTGNGFPGSKDADADVDGGKTTLFSPTFSFLSRPYDQAIVRYRRWYSNDVGARADDVWRVDASNDGGATWTNVETVPTGANAWVPVTVDLQALFGVPDRVRFRFVAADTGRASLVEAAIDDFEILAILHDPVGVALAPLGEPRLGAPTPNPSHGSIALGLVLPRSSTVRAIVLDLQGRRVRALSSGRVMPAGDHTLVWDGRDEHGTLVSAGLYFIQVEADGRRFRTRSVRLQ